MTHQKDFSTFCYHLKKKITKYFLKVKRTFYICHKRNRMPYQAYIEQEKHLVSVDCAVFGYHDNELSLLLFHRVLPPSKGEWSLVGGWVNSDESVEDAASRVLKKITGLEDISQEQVQVFSKPQRDPGGRVITVLFNALIDINKHDKGRVREHGAHWWPINELPDLIFDHNELANVALEHLRQKATYHLVGQDLLPEEFTITQLRQLYNCIFMREFDPGNFRKKILSLDAMTRLNKKDTSESKKGAFLYKFKPPEKITVNERIVKL